MNEQIQQLQSIINDLDEDIGKQIDAIEQLGDLKSVESLRFLNDLIQDEDDCDITKSCLSAFLKIGTNDAVLYFYRAVSGYSEWCDPNSEEIEALINAADPTVLMMLTQKILEQERSFDNFKIADLCISSLSKTRTDDSISYLVDILSNNEGDDCHPSITVAVENALISIGEMAACALIDELYDGVNLFYRGSTMSYVSIERALSSVLDEGVGDDVRQYLLDAVGGATNEYEVSALWFSLEYIDYHEIVSWINDQDKKKRDSIVRVLEKISNNEYEGLYEDAYVDDVLSGGDTEYGAINKILENI